MEYNEVIECDLKKKLEELRKKTMNAKDTKNNILVIKRLLDRLIENCPEVSKKELLEEFLEEYEKDIQQTKNFEEEFPLILQYRAHKELLKKYRNNKNEFDQLVREARTRENLEKEGQIGISKDLKESIIAILRRTIRDSSVGNEHELINNISLVRTELSKMIKDKLIDEMQRNVSFLNEYGFLDEYISIANQNLQELGLEKLKYYKRYPIPDEKYDENGNIIKDSEDIGVLDSFDTEYLEQLSPEELIMMAAFWKTKYMEARVKMFDAMSTIHSLNLRDDILEKDEAQIEELDEKMIEAALRENEVLLHLYRSEGVLTEDMRKQHDNFLRANGISTNKSIEEKVEDIQPEVDRLDIIGAERILLQCVLMQMLHDKDIKIKAWGVMPDSEVNLENLEEDSVAIAIEHDRFRGAYVMGMPKEVLEKYFEGIADIKKLPKFKKIDGIDEKYSRIMSLLYMPSNEFFRKTVKEYYAENPQSPLIANLAGKKPKKIPDNKDDGSR